MNNEENLKLLIEPVLLFKEKFIRKAKEGIL